MSMDEKTFWQKTKWKLIISVILAIVVFIISGFIGFPRLFQWMFVGYVVGGLLFFTLLDARPFKEKSGGAAFASVVIFYIIISIVYTINGWGWPQYDPNEEKEKIAKIIKAKEKMTRADLEAKVEELTKKVEELSSLRSVQALPAQGVAVQAAPVAPRAAPKEVAKAPPVRPGVAALLKVVAVSPAMIAKGKEVYDLYECYNCHKVGGKGGVKRRGPELDHVKDEFTAKQLADRIWYPYAPGRKATEGFEKEFEEKVMPDYYPEQITKEEMDTIVAYLLSLKK